MMPKRDQMLRSAAVSFALAPGDLEFATLDSEPLPDHLMASNSAVRAHGLVSARSAQQCWHLALLVVVFACGGQREGESLSKYSIRCQ